MKRYLLLLILLYNGISNAQNWCLPGAEWKYSTSFYSGESNLKFTYDQDTTINQQECKKIKGRSIKLQYGPPGVPPKITDTISLEPLFSYAKNDTVFFLQNNVFYPVYTFNVNTGDTIHYSNPLVDSNPILQIVDSVGIDTINGLALKYYHTKNKTLDFDPIDPPESTIMERFGALDNDILPFYAPVTEVYYTLLCYKDDSFPLYQKYPTGSCDLINSVSIELLDSNVYLSPNPSNEYININNVSNDIIESVLIYDITGKLRHTSNKKNNNSILTLDITKLQNGIYVMFINTTNGKRIIKKFIKHASN